MHNLIAFDDPLLRNIWINRNIKSKEALQYLPKNLLHYKDLHNATLAAELIYTCMQKKEKIVVVGDYDADGATATALFLRFFAEIDYPIDYFVPNRLEDGYGLTSAIFHKLKSPDLIITVDNGIASIQGCEEAKKYGVKVIITDHHLPGPNLPDALIVNPNLSQCKFSSKNLAGVGVAFYVLMALRAQIKKHQNQKINMLKLLDLVAIGTVADVVPLDYNNRVLISLGINLIRQRKNSLGVQHLLDAVKLNNENVTSTDIAFKVAPKLNAAGRLADMSIGIKCLISSNASNLALALQLCSINSKRQEIEQNILTKAIEQAKYQEALGQKVICVYEDNFHEGVNGIVASRLKDRFNKLVFVFTKAKDGSIKGSARSIALIHVKDLLEYINTNYPDAIKNFGGHAMAAGVTLNTSVANFTKLLASSIEKLNLNPIGTSEKPVDVVVDFHKLTYELCCSLYFDFPWGAGFTEPVLQSEFTVLEIDHMQQKHTRFVLKSDAALVKAVYFNVAVDKHLAGATFMFTYSISINTFYKNQVQLMILKYE